MKFLDISGSSEFFGSLEDGARPLAMRYFNVDACRCPRCLQPFTARVRRNFLAGHRVKCTPCGWKGNWRHGTPLDNSGLSAAKFLYLADYLTLGVPVPTIAKRLGLDPGTVRTWRARLELLLQVAA